jgi:hypothetical protein
MKAQKFIKTNWIPRLLIVPVICTLAFAACSDVDGTARTPVTVNLQNATTDDHVAFDPSTIVPSTLMTRIGR